MSATSGYDGFASFDIDPTASIVTEFNRLAIQKSWKKDSKQYKNQRARLVNQEFNAYFGSNLNDLAAWQALCKAVGITTIPSSVTQCKKVQNSHPSPIWLSLIPFQLLKKVYVNIYDLIDAARLGEVARTFPNNQQLAAYTKPNKVFPKREAKLNKLLKFMLRHIF
ncbi:hypothetical protein EPUS_01344 [Endocarpon pusillum Z07020]|uniref:Uncharacterized protein n=1 Tax=Endocarpon pusillum (strain Z07020 / HMAS-L-300199) TaxID=1263415 RepID=U1GU56_ENDPU|nr:uncharacterized protein EPUS_01344 [Endocarpon pusillum Z07020]ERF75978.1 hypothetical protein EPUS_01344 [Endocarpon pusillum Z07020]